MKLKSIKIKGVGGLTELELSFNQKMNILCGPNGIGKTTVLECIAHSFAVGNTTILKRNVSADTSSIFTSFYHNDAEDSVQFEFNVFEPSERAQTRGKQELSPYLMSLKTTRTFNYSPLNAVSRDTEKQLHSMQEESKQGVSLTDVKNWFVNRYLYSAHEGALSEAQLKNFEVAKTCFSKLDPDVEFARVNATSNEILVKTPAGDIYYEYLSSGFKSCLSILFGIIKEVEFRFDSKNASIKDFEGVVLIDVIELHLHPEWQSKIVGILTEMFPTIQFVVTTHSPHVIQIAEPDQIIALQSKEGNVEKRPLPENEYGFQGWTLDEVLKDVMGMESTRSKTYRSLMQRFYDALDSEDFDLAKDVYDELDKSLHPSNHVRKLLKLQLASIDESNHHD